MGGRFKAGLVVATAAAAVLAAVLIATLSHDAEPATADDLRVQKPVRPALRVMADGEEVADKRRKRKRPAITDLVTSSPVTVDPASTRVVVLSCGRSQGVALDGGVIAPPPPAQVVVTMLSRANPNPPYANSRRNFYVGVRNLDPVSGAQFRASLVCAKGVDVR